MRRTDRIGPQPAACAPNGGDSGAQALAAAVMRRSESAEISWPGE
jgi:hypothetical protein